VERLEINPRCMCVAESSYCVRALNRWMRTDKHWNRKALSPQLSVIINVIIINGLLTALL